jgi:hypothetical protein
LIKHLPFFGHSANALSNTNRGCGRTKQPSVVEPAEMWGRDVRQLGNMVFDIKSPHPVCLVENQFRSVQA